MSMLDLNNPNIKKAIAQIVADRRGADIDRASDAWVAEAGHKDVGGIFFAFASFVGQRPGERSVKSVRFSTEQELVEAINTYVERNRLREESRSGS